MGRYFEEDIGGSTGSKAEMPYFFNVTPLVLRQRTRIFDFKSRAWSTLLTEGCLNNLNPLLRAVLPSPNHARLSPLGSVRRGHTPRQRQIPSMRSLAVAGFSSAGAPLKIVGKSDLRHPERTTNGLPHSRRVAAICSDVSPRKQMLRTAASHDCSVSRDRASATVLAGPTTSKPARLRILVTSSACRASFSTNRTRGFALSSAPSWVCVFSEFMRNVTGLGMSAYSNRCLPARLIWHFRSASSVKEKNAKE